VPQDQPHSDTLKAKRSESQTNFIKKIVFLDLTKL